VFSALISNPGAKVILGVEDPVQIAQQRWVRWVADELQGLLLFTKRDFSISLPNSVRFLQPPVLEKTYVYFADVDFFFYQNIVDQNLEVMQISGLPFNNEVRSGTQRLTGTHFSRVDALWKTQRSRKFLPTAGTK
jgi:hypothetical protein